MKEDNLSADIISKAIISILKKNHKEYLLPDIIQLLKKVKIINNKAVVKTPVSLNDRQKQKVEKMVLDLTRNQNIFIEYQVDPRLIDGIQIEYNDKLWDMSLRNNLNSLLEKIS